MHTQVDAIHQGPRELPAIPLDLVGKAGALAVGIAPEAAGAWVHRGDEDEPCRVCRGAARARDGDGVLLEWLAQSVEDASRELGDLVQEQCSAMRQADFARTWRRSSADEREVRRGVMRRPERARGQDRKARI